MPDLWFFCLITALVFMFLLYIAVLRVNEKLLAANRDLLADNERLNRRIRQINQVDVDVPLEWSRITKQTNIFDAWEEKERRKR